MDSGTTREPSQAMSAGHVGWADGNHVVDHTDSNTVPRLWDFHFKLIQTLLAMATASYPVCECVYHTFLGGGTTSIRGNVWPADQLDWKCSITFCRVP